MEKIYDFLHRNKWLVWAFLIIFTTGFALAAAQCKLEENIFKLLPQSDDKATSLAFNDMKLKDKLFVQVVPKEDATDDVDAIYMADAMDFFMEHLQEKDSALHAIYNTLYEVDPMLMLEAAGYLMEHGPAYLDLTEQEMDSLTSEEHIRQQLHLYDELLNTDMGSYLYDIVTYDPCGFSLAKMVNPEMLTAFADGENQNGRFQNNHIYASDVEACIGFVTPTFGPENSKLAWKLIQRVNEAKEEMETEYPGVELLYHGTIVLAAYNSHQIRVDMGLTFGIALIVILIMLFIFFKRPTYIAQMLLPIIFGILFSLGTIWMINGGMSLMALGLGVIVLGVALSYCLHMLVHYMYTGDVYLTVREQTKPIFYGAFTTIGAFAGLLLTDSPLLKDFGIFALLTVVGATFISLFVLPQFLPKKSTPTKWVFRFLEKINGYKIDHNIVACLIVWLFVAVSIGYYGYICLSGQKDQQFDSNLYHIGYVSDETQRAQDSWNRLMNDGNTQQYYASTATTLEEALEQLPAIEEKVDSLRKAGVILNNMTVSRLMPSLATQEERNEKWINYFTAEKQSEVWEKVQAACYEEGLDVDMFEPFLDGMSFVEEPELVAETGIIPEEILGNFVEETNGTVLVYFPVKTSKEDALMVKDILSKTEGCLVLDPYYYSTSLVDRIKIDFDRIMYISSAFVLLLLLISYRGKIWISLIAFTPMILSWYTVLGAMAIFDQPFNVINIVVSSFIFGIGVDYSIFIMDGLLNGDEDNKTLVIHKTAITLSAFVLIVCMFSLIFATHPAINSIGFVSVVGMVTTIMLSYTIQPNLYRLYLKIQDKKQAKHTTK